MATPPLGYIEPHARTNDQIDAHAKAMSQRVSFGLPFMDLPKGTKVILTDYWKNPLVIKDVGIEFTGFHQLTGSCVGVSSGNGQFTLSAIQRTLPTNPTKAFIPWWPFAYGRTRYNEGDRGQGEGAVVSVMGRTIKDDGTFEITQPGLPSYKTDDGFYLTQSIEMQWSDGGRIEQKWRDIARSTNVGGVATLSNTEGIRTSIVNGYPVLNGCSMYVGHGSIHEAGADSVVLGDYDGRGGHATCFLGVWHHPTLGYLYLYSNQWPTSTYPKDPAGAGRCCVWLRERSVETMFSRLGGNDGETMAISHLNYFPAQPEILNYVP